MSLLLASLSMHNFAPQFHIHRLFTIYTVPGVKRQGHVNNAHTTRHLFVVVYILSQHCSETSIEFDFSAKIFFANIHT